MSESGTIVDAYSVEMAIQMLRQHLGGDEIEPLVALLQKLVEDPQNQSLKEEISQTYAELGVLQGAVLTYAPCLSIVMSDNPFEQPD